MLLNSLNFIQSIQKRSDKLQADINKILQEVSEFQGLGGGKETVQTSNST